MCGIVGVLGSHEAAPLLVEALKRLEYRGYDSAGIATVQDGPARAAARRRQAGQPLRPAGARPARRQASGIGHTRWATHGAPFGGQRASAPGGAGGCRAQRHHREFQGPARRSGTPRAMPARPIPTPRRSRLLARRHLERRASPARGRAGDAGRLEGAFALALALRGRGRPDRRRPQGLASRDRAWRGRDVRRLRRHRAGAADRPDHLSGRGRLRRPHPRASVDIRDAEGLRVHRPERRYISIPGDRQGRAPHFMAKEIAEQPRCWPTRWPITWATRSCCPPRASTSPRSIASAWWPAARPPTPAPSRGTGSSGSRAFRPRSISPRSSATASRRAAAHPRAVRQPVGRDRRHAGRAALLPRQGRA